MKQSCSFDSDVIKSMAAASLLQNCDLPPPLKVFPGLKLYGLTTEDGGGDGGDRNRVGLLTALQLSQTRAREAEKRIQGLAKERDCLSDAVMRESLQGLAYRNWVRVLECQVSALELKVKKRQEEEEEDEAVVVEAEEETVVVEAEEEAAGWVLSWAIPLGIAGIGFAFAFRFLF